MKNVINGLKIMLILFSSSFASLLLAFFGVTIVGYFTGIDVWPMLQFNDATFKEKTLFYTGQIYGVIWISMILFLNKKFINKKVKE